MRGVDPAREEMCELVQDHHLESVATNNAREWGLPRPSFTSTRRSRQTRAASRRQRAVDSTSRTYARTSGDGGERSSTVLAEDRPLCVVQLLALGVSWPVLLPRPPARSTTDLLFGHVLP